MCHPGRTLRSSLPPLGRVGFHNIHLFVKLFWFFGILVPGSPIGVFVIARAAAAQTQSDLLLFHTFPQWINRKGAYFMYYYIDIILIFKPAMIWEDPMSQYRAQAPLGVSAIRFAHHAAIVRAVPASARCQSAQ